MKNKKNLATIVLAALCVVSMLVGSLAFFTDRFLAQTEATAGTLEIQLTEGASGQGWATENSALIDAGYKPSTALKLNYSLTNNGNLKAKVSEKFVISFTKQLSATKEIDLYAKSANLTVDANGNVTANTATPLTLTAGTAYQKDGKTYYPYTFDPTDFTLEASNDGNTDTYNGEYYLVFNTGVSNDFQGVGIIVEYLAEALQDKNTTDSTWTDTRFAATKESVTIGGASIKVVPEK